MNVRFIVRLPTEVVGDPDYWTRYKKPPKFR